MQEQEIPEHSFDFWRQKNVQNFTPFLLFEKRLERKTKIGRYMEVSEKDLG